LVIIRPLLQSPNNHQFTNHKSQIHHQSQIVESHISPRIAECAFVHRQLPPLCGDVMAQDVDIACCIGDFEVPVIRRKPLIEHLRNLHATISDAEGARRLLASITGVALDAQAVCVRH
jgi:hypothetical protein